MTRRHGVASSKRTLSQRLGMENILSDGMLYPVSPTEQALMQMNRKNAKQRNKRNR